MKIVFDTNIYFSAFVFGKRILQMTDFCFKNFEIYTSKELIEEVEAKFFGQKIRKLAINYESERATKFLDYIKDKSILIEVNQVVDLCRDKKDNMILELAQEVYSDFIVTGDKDLLSISQIGNTKILKPVEFYSRIGLNL